MMIYRWLSACPGKTELFRDQPGTCDTPQKQATEKAAWATFSTNTYLPEPLMCTAIV